MRWTARKEVSGSIERSVGVEQRTTRPTPLSVELVRQVDSNNVKRLVTLPSVHVNYAGVSLGARFGPVLGVV